LSHGRNLVPSLSDSTRQLADALADTTEETVVVVGRGGDVYFARDGRPLTTLVGRAASGLVAQAEDYVRQSDLEHVKEAWDRLSGTPGRREVTTMWVFHPDGHMIQFRVSGINRLDDDLAAILLRVSVAATKTAARSLPPSSTTDPPPASMDGAPDSWRGNDLLPRDVFQDILGAAIERKETKIWNAPSFARSIARDRRYDYALILLDLDRNALRRAGLRGGVINTLAAHVAERLSGALRGRDAIGYLGGTELALLLDGVGDAHQATRATDVFLQLFDDPIDVDGKAITVTPAVGIATSERRYAKAADVLRDASAAVARALRKSGGRRRQAFNTKMRIEDRTRLLIMSDLHDAIVREELTLAYQPIISLRTGLLSGFEALARWTHSSMGFVSPADFIPIAEEMGLIRDLGKWVLDKACQTMVAWNEVWAGPEPLVISVNASPHQLAEDALVTDVKATLRRTRLPAKQLRIEITESTVLHDLDATRDMVERLRSEGVTFALDDFGTGYSSLSYLHQLPYDRLKIDRSFLMEATAKREKVLHAIVRLAHAFNMEVVAEGVETEAQKGALERMSCDYAQGYLLSRPLTPEDAEVLLRSNPRW
jgi:EAL domain-containing protein (putative c-di-GMP-specific phosphodiesterase class I)/GGDEF domain-containing protein